MILMDWFLVPFGKLTWQWKITLLKMYYLLKMGIFHCHVSLLEGKLQQDFGVTIVGIPSFYHLLPSRKRENKLTPPNEKFGKSSTQKCLGMGYVSSNEGNDFNEITTRNVDASECSFFSSSVKGSSPKKKQWLTSVKCSTLWRKHVPPACPLGSFKFYHSQPHPGHQIYTLPKLTARPVKMDGWLEDSSFSLVKLLFSRGKNS